MFFFFFGRVLLPRVGRLLKFRPRESESESDSSTYTKSELFAEEKSREEVESFRLIREEEWSERELKLVSVTIEIEGGDGTMVVGKVVISFITSAYRNLGLQIRQ